MSDPQDLLYTNSFLSNNILTSDNISNSTEYDTRFKDYIDSTVINDTRQYLNNNEYETSLINLDRSLDKKWPIDNNKNHYPLFDKFANDLGSNRYKKSVTTRLSIDSRNRDYSKYPNSNNFIIQLPKVFNNVTKMYLNDIIFQNSNQSFNNENNNLSWQYASENFLVENSIDKRIIPVPGDSLISYSSLPNSVFKYTTTNSDSNYISNIDNYLVYQININPGYYSINELIKKIRCQTNQIQHGNTTYKNIVEEPYISNKKNLGSPHLFSIQINPLTSIVRFVNRIEEIKVEAIQTFSQYSDIISTDIFYNFSSKFPNTSLSTELIYILLPAFNDITYQYYYNVNCINTPNPFPLVLTDLNVNIGGIEADILNYTTFFDLNIYTNNGYTESDLDSICYYKFIDTITLRSQINPDNFSIVYLRFGLHLSTGMLNGNIYNNNGTIIKPITCENIIYSTPIYNYITNFGNVQIPVSINTSTGSTSTLYTTSGLLYFYKYLPQSETNIGRAILFRWIYDKDNDNYVTYEFTTLNQKKRTLLRSLSWPIPNQTFNIYTQDYNRCFNFVQTNYQSKYVIDSSYINNEQSQSSNSLNTQQNSINHTLNLYYDGNEYFFSNNNYVFLKILTNSSAGSSSDQLLYVNSSVSVQYEQNYIYTTLLNVGIGEDYTYIQNCNSLKILKKNYDGIIAKIIVSSLPGNININNSNIINNSNAYIFYSGVLDNVNNLNISLYDSNLQLISSYSDYSFTLNVVEDNNVLKETLINTKTNNVSSTGNYI